MIRTSGGGAECSSAGRPGDGATGPRGSSARFSWARFSCDGGAAALDVTVGGGGGFRTCGGGPALRSGADDGTDEGMVRAEAMGIGSGAIGAGTGGVRPGGSAARGSVAEGGGPPAGRLSDGSGGSRGKGGRSGASSFGGAGAITRGAGGTL